MFPLVTHCLIATLQNMCSENVSGFVYTYLLVYTYLFVYTYLLVYTIVCCVWSLKCPGRQCFVYSGNSAAVMSAARVMDETARCRSSESPWLHEHCSRILYLHSLERRRFETKFGRSLRIWAPTKMLSAKIVAIT